VQRAISPLASPRRPFADAVLLDRAGAATMPGMRTGTRRSRALLFALVVLTLSAAASPAQEAERAADEVAACGGPADFDYLLGDWAFTAKSRQWGRFGGSWSAVRLPEGQILDEYRVVGDDGDTLYVTTTLRNFNRATGRWDLVGADAGGGLRDTGTAGRVGDEMHVEQTFGATSDSPSLWRIRYFDIRADRFSWAADRSTDGGKTWVKDFQTIEARRVGPPRELPPLTRPGAATPPESP
jgi:hypothetical protein